MAQIKKGVTIICLMIGILILTILIIADQSLAATIQIPDGAYLIEQAKALNGQEVEYQGEVIGDVMRRSDHDWINVLNNGTAIGIWITGQQRALIGMTGRYGVQGDTVRIVGLFNQACAEHGGDLDIHASSLEIVQPGVALKDELNIKRLILALIMLILSGVSLTIMLYPRIGKRTR